MDITVDMAMDTVLDMVDMVMATTDTARGLLTLRLNLPLLPSPDTDMEDTVDMVDMDMDTVIIDMARGLLMLRPAMDMAMDMVMEAMDMDMALDMDMVMVIDMARGLLRLPLDTTDIVDTDIMDITDTMAMDMDMARGQLRPPLDTTDIMDITDTTDTMVMDMVDMDTMVRKERYLTGFPVCLTSRIQ